MTGRNCYFGIMGSVLSDNCRKVLGRPSPLNESLEFLKCIQVLSSHWLLNHALSNKSSSVWGKGLEIRPEGKGCQVGMGMGYHARGWDFSQWGILETLNQECCIFSLCL